MGRAGGGLLMPLVPTRRWINDRGTLKRRAGIPLAVTPPPPVVVTPVQPPVSTNPTTVAEMLASGTVTDPVHIGVVDSSSAFGAGPTGTPAPKDQTSWPGQLRTTLTATYGYGGSGKHLCNHVLLANPTWDSKLSFFGTATTVAGGWHRTGAIQTAAGSGHGMQLVDTCTEFVVEAQATTTGLGWYSIDGGTPRSFQLMASGGPTADVAKQAGHLPNQIVVTLPAGTLGQHTLRVWGEGVAPVWTSAEARTSAGKVIVDNLAMSGKSLATMGFVNAGANDLTGGTYGTPQLEQYLKQGRGILFVGLTGNEWMATGNTLSTVANRLDAVIALARKYPRWILVLTIQQQPSPTLKQAAFTFTELVTMVLAKGATQNVLVKNNQKLFAGYGGTDVSNITDETQLYNLAAGKTPDLMADEIHPNFEGSRVLADSTLAYLVPSTPGDWSTTRTPYAYTNSLELTAGWPAANIDDILTGSSDYLTNVRDTVSAANSRVVVRHPEGLHRQNRFVAAGTTDLDSLYAFGNWWSPNYQGVLGAGAGKTIIQQDANSYRSGQLARLAELGVQTAGSPLQTGMARFDGSPSSPVLIAGVTFQGADQQMLTSTQANATGLSDMKVPQPAPYQGIFIYPGSDYIVQYTQFLAAGHAATSLPPFEMGQLVSQRCRGVARHIEIDGRLAASLNAARPRRGALFMLNNEGSNRLEDAWLHHNNISRYALNDENYVTSGAMSLTRVKFEEIANNRNTDPALGPLGGYTNASHVGLESFNGSMVVTDFYGVQSNTYTDRQISQFFQLTTPPPLSHSGRPDPEAIAGVTKFEVIRGTFRNLAIPALDGWCTFRITDTHWRRNNYRDIYVRADVGAPAKTPWVYNSTWTNAAIAAAIQSAGVSWKTHYLVRNT